ncbi:MAG: hypothetical protein ACI840_002016, partial [Ulvibacter sp.]
LGNSQLNNRQFPYKVPLFLIGEILTRHYKIRTQN